MVILSFIHTANVHQVLLHAVIDFHHQTGTSYTEFPYHHNIKSGAHFR